MRKKNDNQNVQEKEERERERERKGKLPSQQKCHQMVQSTQKKSVNQCTNTKQTLIIQQEKKRQWQNKFQNGSMKKIDNQNV